MKNLNQLLLGVFTLIGTCAFSQVQSNSNVADTLNPWDMSLEDLMNIQVVSATKSSFSSQKAPSVVRVFTSKDFERNGFFTLQDVLNSVPGLQLQEYRAGHQLVWIRGVQARYNNKVLLLIDGVPMRDSYYGNFNVDDMIPLEHIEKIEVLNGPGSVLYGANSFSGVISITTKSEGKSLRAAYGTFNRTEVFGEYSHNGLYVNGKYMQTDGFQPELMSNGKRRVIDQSQQLGMINVKYKKNDLTAQAGITHYEYPYRYRSTDKDYQFTRTPITGSIAYTPKLTENSSISVLGYVNQYDFVRNKTKFTSDESDSLKEHSINNLSTNLMGLDFSYNLTLQKHQLILGTSWMQDRPTEVNEIIDFHEDGASELGLFETLTDPDIRRSFVGFFAQDVYNINDYLLVTGGIRYDVLNTFDDQFNYRFGLTGQKNNLYAKALYGTAFRVPSYREYLNVDAPNPDLKPEHLNTGELQVGYVNSKTDINLTFFNNAYTDFIQEIVVDSIDLGGGNFNEIDDEMAFNFDSRNISGLELNVKTSFASGLSLNGGMSYFFNYTEQLGGLDPRIYTSQPLDFNETDLTFLSRTSGFLNLSYTISDRYLVSFNNLFAGSRNVPSNYQTDVPVEVRNPTNANGYVRSDLFLSSSLLPSKNLLVTLRVTNLFDQLIFSPPYGGSDGFDIEWPGRQFRLGVDYRF